MSTRCLCDNQSVYDNTFERKFKLSTFFLPAHLSPSMFCCCRRPCACVPRGTWPLTPPSPAHTAGPGGSGGQGASGYTLPHYLCLLLPIISQSQSVPVYAYINLTKPGAEFSKQIVGWKYVFSMCLCHSAQDTLADPLALMCGENSVNNLYMKGASSGSPSPFPLNVFNIAVVSFVFQTRNT